MKNIDFDTTFKIDMKQIEKKAISSGILDDLDDPKDIEAEFYSTPKTIEVQSTPKIEDRANIILEEAEVETPKQVIEDVKSEPEEQQEEKLDIFD